MWYTHALPTLRNLYIISSLVIMFFREEIRISATHTRQGRVHNRQPEGQRSVLRHQFDSYIWAVSEQRGKWWMAAGWTGLVTCYHEERCIIFLNWLWFFHTWRPPKRQKRRKNQNSRRYILSCCLLNHGLGLLQQNKQWFGIFRNYLCNFLYT